MKYKLFAAADPSNSKIIGTADTVNVLPEINKQGQFCWRSRPGLGNHLGGGAGYDFGLGTANDPDQPVTRDDAYETDEDQSLTVAAPGVLSNDSDPNNDALTAMLWDGPAHGVLTLSPDGSFVYTPAPNYNGPDSFAYQAFDGTHRGNIATVTITVNPAPTGDCLYDGTVFESVFGVPTWDVIDNETGTYSCTPGPVLNARIRASLTPGTMKTCYIIYKITGFTSTVCNDSVYLHILNEKLVLTETSTLCYGSIGPDVEAFYFVAGYPAKDCAPAANPQGTVTVECVKIIDRDWVSAGEEEGKIYYP